MAVPFYLVNAFTNSLYGGNPAAVVLIHDDLPTDILQNVARNFNQPVTTFIHPLTSSRTAETSTATFKIRWFTVSTELSLCGHGTLAAAGMMFSTPDMLPHGTEVLHFEGFLGHSITARKIGDKVEIAVPTAIWKPVPAEQAEHLKSIVRRGLGKNVTTRFMGVGGRDSDFSQLLVEIDEQDDLESCQANTYAFLETGYEDTLVTSASSVPGIAFTSRVFSPEVGVPEDHVCGSAHGLLVPYWAGRLGFGGKEVLARQVSPRGGELGVALQRSSDLVRLRGEIRITAKGDVFL